MSQLAPSHAGGIPLTTVPQPTDLVPVLVKWRIVIARRGKHFLYLLVLDESLAGSDVMRRVMELYRTETISLASRTRHLLHTLVAETAELEWAPDIEAQYYPQRVALINSSRHRGLTEACRDPAALASASGFAALHPEFIVPAAGGPGPGAVAGVGSGTGAGPDCTKAILVHAQVTGTSVALLMCALFVSLLVGLLVGYKLGRTDVAMGVSGIVACALAAYKPLRGLRK